MYAVSEKVACGRVTRVEINFTLDIEPIDYIPFNESNLFFSFGFRRHFKMNTLNEHLVGVTFTSKHKLKESNLCFNKFFLV